MSDPRNRAWVQGMQALRIAGWWWDDQGQAHSPRESKPVSGPVTKPPVYTPTRPRHPRNAAWRFICRVVVLIVLVLDVFVVINGVSFLQDPKNQKDMTTTVFSAVIGFGLFAGLTLFVVGSEIRATRRDRSLSNA